MNLVIETIFWKKLVYSIIVECIRNPFASTFSSGTKQFVGKIVVSDGNFDRYWPNSFVFSTMAFLPGRKSLNRLLHQFSIKFTTEDPTYMKKPFSVHIMHLRVRY